ncbi:hypothetical protein [Neisseria flavescens]|nr:hypothetical protein [Neisseria flavescens]
MRNLKLTLAVFFGGIFALWLFAAPFPDKWDVFPIRNSSPAASAYWP